jgi:hypothetical protein
MVNDVFRDVGNSGFLIPCFQMTVDTLIFFGLIVVRYRVTRSWSVQVDVKIYGSMIMNDKGRRMKHVQSTFSRGK